MFCLSGVAVRTETIVTLVLTILIALYFAFCLLFRLPELLDCVLMEGGVAADEDYKPPADFVEDWKDPLIDIELKDSTELWLIQWPNNIVSSPFIAFL